jgi:hypothetical protein
MGVVSQPGQSVCHRNDRPRIGTLLHYTELPYALTWSQCVSNSSDAPAISVIIPAAEAQRHYKHITSQADQWATASEATG